MWNTHPRGTAYALQLLLSHTQAQMYICLYMHRHMQSLMIFFSPESFVLAEIAALLRFCVGDGGRRQSLV